VAADNAKNECNSKPKGSTEGDEIPKGWKSQNEDQGAANREQEAYESAVDGQSVHADAGMTIFGH
jgi:hypothetical protein